MNDVTEVPQPDEGRFDKPRGLEGQLELRVDGEEEAQRVGRGRDGKGEVERGGQRVGEVEQRADGPELNAESRDFA